MATDDVYVIVKRTIDGNVVRYIERMKERFVAGVVEPSRSFFVDSGLSYDGSPATVFSGLDHLEGEDVSVLADGNVVTGMTVASGSITIPNAASVVVVGLPFTSTLETLDFELRGANGSPTIHNNHRNVNGVTVKLKDTRAMNIGPDTDSLEEQNFRTDEDPGDPTELYSGDWKLPLNPGNADEAVVVIQNTDPLPINVLSIVAELEVGEI